MLISISQYQFVQCAIILLAHNQYPAPASIHLFFPSKVVKTNNLSNRFYIYFIINAIGVRVKIRWMGSCGGCTCRDRACPVSTCPVSTHALFLQRIPRLNGTTLIFQVQTGVADYSPNNPTGICIGVVYLVLISQLIR